MPLRARLVAVRRLSSNPRHQAANFRARAVRPLYGLAVLMMTGCAAGPRAELARIPCSALVPPEWRAPGAGAEQARLGEAIGIVERCEERDRRGLIRSRIRRLLGLALE